jgi:hypothetical protein
VVKLSAAQSGQSPTIGLRLPVELREGLDRLAAQHGLERSAMLRRLIAAAVARRKAKKMARREDQSLEPGTPTTKTFGRA